MMTLRNSSSEKGPRTARTFRTLTREKVRRFWLLPAGGFLALFLAVDLPLFILIHSRGETASAYLQNMVTSPSLLSSILPFVLALITACAVFVSLHRQSSAGLYQSFPVNRRQLFLSDVISGLILLAIPIFLTGLLLLSSHLAFTTVTADQWDTEGLRTIMAIRAPSFPWIWMGITFLVTFFYYSIACLAGILAGTGVIHALLTLFLTVMVPSLTVLTYEMASFYLLGFGGEFPTSLIQCVLPPYWLAARAGEAGGGSMTGPLLACFLEGLLILAAACFFFQKLKLEREQDSVVWPRLADALVVLLTFMSVLAVLFFTNDMLGLETSGYFPLFAAVLTLLFFLVYRIIADRTTKILNRRTLLSFLVCLGALALFLGAVRYDMTGYARRIPEPSKVASVTLADDANLLFGQSLKLTSPKSVKAATKAHQAVVQKLRASESDSTNAETSGTAASDTSVSDTLTLTYHLKSGRTLRRRFYVPDAVNMPDLQALFNTPEVRRDLAPDRLLGKDLTEIAVVTSPPSDSTTGWRVNVAERDRKAILQAAAKDIQAFSYAELMVHTSDVSEPGLKLQFVLSKESGRVDNGDGAGLLHLIPVDNRTPHLQAFLKTRPYLKDRDQATEVFQLDAEERDEY